MGVHEDADDLPIRPTAASANDLDAHARIIRLLAGQPALLAHYLEAVAPAVQVAKGQRLVSYEDAAVRSFKFTFQPYQLQLRLHRLLSAAAVAGKSAWNLWIGLSRILPSSSRLTPAF